jgi:hypothetical protein
LVTGGRSRREDFGRTIVVLSLAPADGSLRRLDTDGIRERRCGSSWEAARAVGVFWVLWVFWVLGVGKIGGLRLILLSLAPTDGSLRRLNANGIRECGCGSSWEAARAVGVFWVLGVGKIGGLRLIFLSLAPANGSLRRLDTDGVRECRCRSNWEAARAVGVFWVLRVGEIGGLRLILLSLAPADGGLMRLNANGVRECRCGSSGGTNRIFWVFRIFWEGWDIRGFRVLAFLSLAPANGCTDVSVRRRPGWGPPRPWFPGRRWGLRIPGDGVGRRVIPLAPTN